MMLLYRIWQVVVMIPVIVVWTIITASFTFLVSLLGFGRWAGYWPQVLWARVFCWFAFVKVTVSGRENVDKHKPYIFLANHQGAYDIFAVYGYLGHNFRWMMKQSLRRIPFVGLACAASKQIFVDNSTPGATRHTIREAEEKLRSGMSLVVFPEGSRTRDGRMHRFKRGAFKLAAEFSLPIVPLTIDGAFHVMPRQALLPRPGRIHLTIHAPINPPEGGFTDVDALMAATSDAIASSLPAANKPLSK